MNTVIYQKILLKIIEEEIDRFLFEQAAPPAAPAAPATPPADPAAGGTPPADPSASGGEESSDEEGGDEEEPKDDLEKTMEKLASKTAIDIKKTLLSALQNGAEKEQTQTLVAYVTNKAKKEKQGEEETKEVPENIEKAVKHIVKTFRFKVPEKAKEEAEEKVEEDKTEEEGSEDETASTETPAATPPAAPAAPAAPVKESRLQTTLREYLLYKELSKRAK